MKASKKRLADAVTASGSLVDRHLRDRPGAGRHDHRLHRRPHPVREPGRAMPTTTAPPRSTGPRVATTSVACRGAGTANSTTPSTWPRSPRSASRTAAGRGYYDAKLAAGKTKKKALRALKRKISDALYKRLKADAARAARQPGGRPGNGSSASVAGSHPKRPALRTSHSRTCPAPYDLGALPPRPRATHGGRSLQACPPLSPRTMTCTAPQQPQQWRAGPQPLDTTNKEDRSVAYASDTIGVDGVGDRAHLRWRS